ncbi:hypothetical protein [Hymenobacter psoromatis]|uniref:hypothetical protein n=1 Tax=Hymenobacter psoromatis TaxID=1484116 RepID=UPI001CBDC111|nr:hypothetical protein [Hymenobacter psoromatis]
MKKGRISLSAVRSANGKLVSGSGKSAHIVSDNSRNGALIFSAVYVGKSYDLNISKDAIKSAYAESRAKTIMKEK